MLHSTGANNTKLSRYVQPDDGRLGDNPYNNDWNQAKPGGRQVCVHGFIGKLKDGSIATYQTLPWDYKGWHSGGGFLGNANNQGYIGVEICEDSLTDAAYFNAVYKEAVELFAMLCEKFSIKPVSPYVICHCEGNKLGIASNHGDVMHWFSKHGKTMDMFRADVANKLGYTAKLIAQPKTEEKADTKGIKVGDKVKITDGATYGGSANGRAVPSWVIKRFLTVAQIKKA